MSYVIEVKNERSVVSLREGTDTEAFFRATYTAPGQVCLEFQNDRQVVHHTLTTDELVLMLEALRRLQAEARTDTYAMIPTP